MDRDDTGKRSCPWHGKSDQPKILWLPTSMKGALMMDSLSSLPSMLLLSLVMSDSKSCGCSVAIILLVELCWKDF